ncbi:MAG: hypothetical protein PHD04_03930 [Candidatus Pacebacteria bacterium]|nr:hypothetical protein [Candidatus Paceibacterota bacterium]
MAIKRLDRMAAWYFGNEKIRIGIWYWIYRYGYFDWFIYDEKNVFHPDGTPAGRIWRLRLWRLEIDYRLGKEIHGARRVTANGYCHLPDEESQMVCELWT